VSQALSKARRQIGAVNSLLKRKSAAAAVHGLRDAVAVMVSTALLKAERREFSDMVDAAVRRIDADPGLRKSVPVKLSYKPGEEKDLLRALDDILAALDGNSLDEAKRELEELERRKAQSLAGVRSSLEAGDAAACREQAGRVVREFPDDNVLLETVADALSGAGLYEDAAMCLDMALRTAPDRLALYNKIAVALRKVSKFAEAEGYFKKALEYGREDPHLFFNLGRVYIDWGRFDKAEQAARIALALARDFEEAGRMLRFACARQSKDVR
jgi:predicted Zn-dependent protease